MRLSLSRCLHWHVKVKRTRWWWHIFEDFFLTYKKCKTSEAGSQPGDCVATETSDRPLCCNIRCLEHCQIWPPFLFACHPSKVWCHQGCFVSSSSELRLSSIKGCWLQLLHMIIVRCYWVRWSVVQVSSTSAHCLVVHRSMWPWSHSWVSSALHCSPKLRIWSRYPQNLLILRDQTRSWITPLGCGPSGTACTNLLGESPEGPQTPLF